LITDQQVTGYVKMYLSEKQMHACILCCFSFRMDFLTGSAEHRPNFTGYVSWSMLCYFLLTKTEE